MKCQSTWVDGVARTGVCLFLITSSVGTRAEATISCGAPPLSNQGITVPVRAIYKPDRWRYLPTTMRTLAQHGELQVVTLGDSIVNDTFGPQTGAGGFHTSMAWGLERVAQSYRATLWAVVAVRGSTGAWWYREPGRVQMYVLDFSPNLVLIGGISHRDDIDAIRDVIAQIRAWRNTTEIVLMTDAVNLTATPQESSLTLDVNADTYRARLSQLADEVGAGFIDMRGSYNEFVLEVNRLYPSIGYDYFQRDAIHANLVGSTVLREIVTQFFLPDAPCQDRQANAPPSAPNPPSSPSPSSPPSAPNVPIASSPPSAPSAPSEPATATVAIVPAPVSSGGGAWGLEIVLLTALALLQGRARFRSAGEARAV